MEKPFWKSKKFIYALATFLAALILAVLPSVADLKPETADMLSEMLPKLLIIGGLVITGHTATDLLYTWRESISPQDLATATHELINSLPLEDLAKLLAKADGGPAITQAGELLQKTS